MGQKSQPQRDKDRTGSTKGELYFSRTLIRLQKKHWENPNSPLSHATLRTTPPLTTGEILSQEVMPLTSPCPSSSLAEMKPFLSTHIHPPH